jgi:hypothetical protein
MIQGGASRRDGRWGCDLGGISAWQFTSNRLKAIGLRDQVDSFKTSKTARKRVTLPPAD